MGQSYYSEHRQPPKNSIGKSYMLVKHGWTKQHRNSFNRLSNLRSFLITHWPHSHHFHFLMRIGRYNIIYVACSRSTNECNDRYIRRRWGVCIMHMATCSLSGTYWSQSFFAGRPHPHIILFYQKIIYTFYMHDLDKIHRSIMVLFTQTKPGTWPSPLDSQVYNLG